MYAKLNLLSGLFTVRCCAETVEPTLSLLKLVHRCCTVEAVVLKFLALLTTAQLYNVQSNYTCRKNGGAVFQITASQ